MAGETAGVGLFFQQDAQGTIFVASLTPGAAADRTGVIQKGDIVLKVDDVTVTGMSLAKVRDYVIEKNNDYAAQKDKLSQLLQRNQIEDPRVKELANELKSRSEDLRQLQETRIRTKERQTDAERRRMETQTRLERECAEKLNIESRLRTVKNESADFERAFEEEFALWRNVQEKLKHDVEIEVSSKQLAEEALSQAFSACGEQTHLSNEMLDLRLKEQRISRCLSNVHDALDKASRLNDVVDQELHAYTPALDAAQGWFLNELVTTLRNLSFGNMPDNTRSTSQTVTGNTQLNMPGMPPQQQNVIPAPRTPRSPMHNTEANADIDIDSLVMKYGLNFDDHGYAPPKPPATPPRPKDLEVLA
ncbi:hypothetical protein GUITHDRAFT_133137 [Guillardia theta CCMP2712]|uniref:PDZ domain-containing protein n=1 Tax=Guillardia theta (strain CCMP2712) TaxID=905079 RepID=L1JYK8_GUITC|nr:hypothetical protein GUITHDRAFT_133137 [Guillardia theta CCMP2712]EKX53419.1 hypothetical protein GUITHDRAFT_133137 [Guillardia theta CCMP2712]|eukprot:XP_005840399.1 hypothetical protein GUITHDRAFT_133137 [Guillardia theta CCMP2712]